MNEKLNNHIARVLLNEYGGSEKKETIIFENNEKYLLKKPDPTREHKRKELCPYQNNPFSEYVGCKISKSMGFPTQDVSLWEYDTPNSRNQIMTKIVCLCKDFRGAGEILGDLEKAVLGSDVLDSQGRITFSEMEQLLCW